MPSATGDDMAVTGVGLPSPFALAAKHLASVGRITDRLNRITASGGTPARVVRGGMAKGIA
jgi:hypothetical protein